MSSPPSGHPSGRTAGAAGAELSASERRELLARLLRERRPRSRVHPVSFAQFRLWFLCELVPDSWFYNSAVYLQLEGPLDRNALQRSLDEIVRRHESLCTSFRLDPDRGEPVQVIEEHRPVAIDVLDLQEVAPERQEEEAKARAADFIRAPFDLTQCPLYRVRLTRLSDGRHMLLLVFHHAVFDGWSNEVLRREFAVLYDAYADGHESPLAPLPIQYADFAEWQRRHLRGETLDRHLGYWRERLNALPTLELPTDHPRPALPSFQGAREHVTLPVSFAEALEALGRSHGATLYATTLSAVAILLQRYGGKDDIVIGTPIANRNRPELEELIGFFVNSLVLRFDLSGDPSFRTLLTQVRNVSLEAFEHQDLPFEKLVDEIDPRRDISRNPLFQVTFDLRSASAPLPSPELAGLEVKGEQIESHIARFDLEFSAIRNWEEFRIQVNYSTDLFEATTIRRMLRHLEMLLRGALADPDQPISRLPLLNDAERDAVLELSRGPTVARPRDDCMHTLVEAQAQRTPDRVALICDSEQLTYGALNARANQIAHTLCERGVGPESMVGICLERNLDLVAGILGILKAGGAYVPLDPAYPQDRLEFIVRDSGAQWLVTQADLLEKLPAHDADVICLDRDRPSISAAPSRNPERPVWPSNLAYLIYTSGSTGRPKGVAIAHASAANLLYWVRDVFDDEELRAVLASTSICFDLSIFELFGPLSWGGTVILAENALALPELACKDQVRLINTVPSAVAALLRQRALPSSVQTVNLAGEPLRRELVDKVYASGVKRVFDLYGPSETTTYSTGVLRERNGAETIGRPLANEQVYIVDRAIEPVPPGVAGELYIGGAGVARGYFARPELTAERFVPDPFGQVPGARLYRTGDLARYQSDGSIKLLGRLDHQVKLRGYRIELGEIETKLAALDWIREAVVTFRESENEDGRLVAYLVAEESAMAGQERQHVDQWQALWGEVYTGMDAAQDPTFNTHGWNSSYTGEPIPAEQMREWVERTVERIQLDRPRRVLEIGCGTGLLLFRVAPECESYVGTDLSSRSLDYVKGYLEDQGLASSVSLEARLADDFHGLEEQSFDTVILNSVIQYFPSVEYLLGVLEKAVRSTRDGGVVFVGDVRSLPLLEVFHASVQLHQAPAETTASELANRARERMGQEEELVVDPALFLALAQQSDRIGRVEILPKRGDASNELTKFRYDVRLHIGEKTSADEDLGWLNWEERGLTLDAIGTMLREHAPPMLALRGIPNARTQGDVLGAQLIRARGERLASSLRSEVAQAAHGAVDPEAIQRLGEELEYTVTLSWAETDAEGRFDALLVGAPIAAGEIVIPTPSVRERAWDAYANLPVAAKMTRQLTPRVREHLESSLPAYMVPSAFVVLNALPLTPNGKIDRAALPAPDRSLSLSRGAYVAPRTVIERQLVTIWSEVLGLNRIGVRENFFELGGDSILSIQVVSRARDAGVQISPQLMFKHQTIEELAAVAASAESAALPAEQGTVTGAVPLTPVQRAFFEWEWPEPHHYNQSVLLELSRPLDPEVLRAAWTSLLAHHDGLRMRYRRDGAEWRQEISAPSDGVAFEVVQLDGLGPDEVQRRVEHSAATAQSSLDLQNGPLVRVVFFDRGPSAPPWMLAVIHHLVVDGVSWRILLEDLQRACAQLEACQPLTFPPKTSSFRHWALGLQRAVAAGDFDEELEFWTDVARRCDALVPRDHDLGPNLVEAAETVSCVFDEHQTRAILQDVPHVYNTQINDVLLAALARSLSEWTGRNSVVVELEGHGREDVVAGADLSRTVGWFTSFFPVRVDLDGAGEPGAMLRTVKEQLRAVPRRGIGFGLLAHLHPRAAAVRELHQMEAPEISFNYLGQFDQVVGGGGLFRPAPLRSGPARSPRNGRPALLEINARVIGGRLQAEWGYSRNHHRRETIDRIAARFTSALLEITEHCGSAESSRYTPSDFPMAGLDQSALDRLVARVRGDTQ